MTLKLNGSSSGSVSIDAPASTTSGADITFNLPVADGSSGQALTTNASGQLAFSTIGGGKVLQYVYETVSAGTTDLTTSGSTELEVIDATITPSATSSKILVLGHLILDVTASSNALGYVRLYRGAMGGTQLQHSTQGIMTGTNFNGEWNPWVIDSPNTTSAQEYTMSMGRASSGTSSISTEAQSHYRLILVELEG